MDQERDCVVFQDDDGNELVLDVLDYFFYNGQEYAILADMNGKEAEGCGCGCCHECGEEHEECCEHDECCEGECDCEDEETDIYIMKVIVNEDEEYEEFVPVEDELIDEIEAFVQKKLDGEDVDGFDEEDE